MDDILKQAKKNMTIKEESLSEYACKSKNGIYIKRDTEDIRPIFYRDIDRIIHSSGYTRYIDKTQVYSFVSNDHITKRAIHVQLVSKIARTIGRSLLLNEDLIEAISLGHDIGHAPFGHEGEKLLNKICEEEKIGCFCHNAQSVKILKDIEGLNISIQTLDGILAHNGEILKDKYEYNNSKTIEDLENDIKNAFKYEEYSKQIIPMTLEACAVRLSDVIAYIGRDVEDAITIGIINREDIPEEITKVLGNTNSKIVDTLIKDVIINSFGKNYLQLSPHILQALIRLKDWNYEKIYNSNIANIHYDEIESLFSKLYYCYLDKLKSTKNAENESEELFLKFAFKMLNQGESKERTVIDYIAGQTDKFFLKECEINLGRLNFKF